MLLLIPRNMCDEIDPSFRDPMELANSLLCILNKAKHVPADYEIELLFPSRIHATNIPLNNMRPTQVLRILNKLVEEFNACDTPGLLILKEVFPRPTLLAACVKHVETLHGTNEFFHVLEHRDDTWTT